MCWHCLQPVAVRVMVVWAREGEHMCWWWYGMGCECEEGRRKMTEPERLEFLAAEPWSTENSGTAHSCQRFLPGLSALETKLPPPQHRIALVPGYLGCQGCQARL